MAAALAAGLLLALAAPFTNEAQAQTTTTPPTLTGERFDDPTPTVSASCNPDGTSTITFEASGVATGPYPGTFTETGTATVGPQPSPTPFLHGTGTVTSFTATFTIDSPIGQVTGSKELLADLPNQGICQDGVPNEVRRIAFVNVFQDARYAAQIEAPDGESFVDRGSTVVGVIDAEVFPAFGFIEHRLFGENFTSQLPAVLPPLPTTREQCMNGGFRAFGFKNQGECVAFVERGPKKAT